MQNTSPFKIMVLAITVLLAVLSILVFSGKLPWFGANDTGPKLSGKVTVWGTLPESKMKDYLSNFNAQTVGYTMEYSEVQPKNFKNTLVNAISVGMGPDVIIANSDILLSVEGYLSQISYTQYSQTNYKNTFVDAGDIFLRNKGVMALPIAIDPMVLFYNRDLQNQAGIIDTPKDWNTILKYAEKYTKNGDMTGVFRMSVLPFGSYANYDYSKDVVMMLINQLGGNTIYKYNDIYISGIDEKMDGGNTTYIDSVVRYMANYSDPSLKSFTWSPRMQNALSTFTSNNLMYYPAYISDASLIRAVNPRLDFDYAFMPQVPDKDKFYTSARVLGIALMANNKNNLAASDMVLAFATSKGISNSMSNLAELPSPRKDTLAGDGSTAYGEIVGKSILIAKPFLDIDIISTNSLVDNMFKSIGSNRQDISDAVNDFVSLLNKMYNVGNY